MEAPNEFRYSSRRRIVGVSAAAVVFLLALIAAPIADVGATTSASPPSSDSREWRTRIAALKQIQRSLEHYSLVSAENLLRRAAAVNTLQEGQHAHRFSDADSENVAEWRTAARTSAASTDDAPPPATAKFMRVRVGLRPQNSVSAQNSSDSVDNHAIDDRNGGELMKVKLLSSNTNINNIDDNLESDEDGASTRRQLRHAASGSSHFSYSNSELHRHRHNNHLGGQRRRRKGCPPMHGKDQLLCPTRNAHRYDVCVTREQLCDHVADCPKGEDEDPAQCFFYKPVDDQLKTLSHAVLLVVESVMSDQQRRQRQQADDL